MQISGLARKRAMLVTSLADQWKYHHHNTATTTAQLGKLLLLLPKLPTIAAALMAASSSRQRTPSFRSGWYFPEDTRKDSKQQQTDASAQKSKFKITWILRQFYRLWKRKVASFQALMRKQRSLSVLQFCAFWYFCAKTCYANPYVFDVAVKIDQRQ